MPVLYSHLLIPIQQALCADSQQSQANYSPRRWSWLRAVVFAPAVKTQLPLCAPGVRRLNIAQNNAVTSTGARGTSSSALGSLVESSAWRRTEQSGKTIRVLRSGYLHSAAAWQLDEGCYRRTAPSSSRRHTSTRYVPDSSALHCVR